MKSFFIADTDVISVDTKKLLSNPRDRELYFQTIDNLREKADKRRRQSDENSGSITADKSFKTKEIRETITLSDDTKVTLTL